MNQLTYCIKFVYLVLYSTPIVSGLKCYKDKMINGTMTHELGDDLTKDDTGVQWKRGPDGWVEGPAAYVCGVRRINNVVEHSTVSSVLHGKRAFSCYTNAREADANHSHQVCYCATDGCNREMPDNIERYQSRLVSCASSTGGASYYCGGRSGVNIDLTMLVF